MKTSSAHYRFVNFVWVDIYCVVNDCYNTSQPSLPLFFVHDFQVLDEIHRQPVSLSLSMVSLPAPESVVDSFPLKSHKKADKAESGEDVEQYVYHDLTFNFL